MPHMHLCPESKSLVRNMVAEDSAVVAAAAAAAAAAATPLSILLPSLLALCSKFGNNLSCKLLLLLLLEHRADGDTFF